MSHAFDSQPREGLLGRLHRWLLSFAYTVRPKRLHELPRLVFFSLEWKLRPESARRRLMTASARGVDRELIAVVDDYSVETALAALRDGIYPRAHMGPLKWFSPDIRSVIDPNNTHVEKNLRRYFRQGKWTISFDRDFAGVLNGCADTGNRKYPVTWLRPRAARVYAEMHDAGYAHSCEVWDENGELIGGLFGIALGGVFFGQSQFHTKRDASKVAVIALHRHLAHWGYKLRDAQRVTSHLNGFGFTAMPRAEFNALLTQHINVELNAPWTFDPSLDIANWQKEPADEAKKSG